MIVALDAGHGGSSPCAKGYGVDEAEYCLEFVNRLAAHVRGSGEPVRVVKTRSRSEYVSFARRSSIIVNSGASWVLSVHCNSAGNHLLSGALALHWPGNETMADIGDEIIRCVPRVLRRPREGAWAATPDEWPEARQVLGAYSQPTLLLELGYLSNPVDAAALRDPIVQHGLIVAVEVGLAAARSVL